MVSKGKGGFIIPRCKYSVYIFQNVSGVTCILSPPLRRVPVFQGDTLLLLDKVGGNVVGGDFMYAPVCNTQPVFYPLKYGTRLSGDDAPSRDVRAPPIPAKSRHVIEEDEWVERKGRHVTAHGVLEGENGSHLVCLQANAIKRRYSIPSQPDHERTPVSNLIITFIKSP